MTILETIDDRKLFASLFEGDTWKPWRAFLGALFGLPLDGEGLDTFQRHTGRKTPPSAAAREAWLVVGRRGGKSRIAALVAVYLACFYDYARILARGERALVMVIAADRDQARVVFGYVLALLEDVPMLRRRIERRTRTSIDLTNRISIEVRTASHRTTRGYTIAAAIFDEVAFWPTDGSASPDTEIAAAVRPGMATIPHAMLLGISSPYARRGVLWSAYREHYGKDDASVLVWKGDSLSMNPAVNRADIEKAYAADRVSASAEWGAEFRRDVQEFVSRETVEACVVPGLREIPPVRGTTYAAFVDPAGGSEGGGRLDSMVLAIAHAEARNDGFTVPILDCVREVKPKFSPEEVVREFVETLRRYDVVTVVGDNWGSEWCQEPFRKAGIEYEKSARTKSVIYQNFLPVLNSARVQLLDEPRLIGQLCGLERRTGRGGRDSIDHGPSLQDHDDVINAAAGALLLAAEGTSSGYNIDVLNSDAVCGTDKTADPSVVAILGLQHQRWISQLKRFR